MSLLDTIKNVDADEALDLTARGLDTIGQLAGNATAKTAADVVMAIKHIYDAVVGAAEGRVTPEEARKEMAKLLDGIESNDAAADKAVDAKFGGGGE